MIKKRDYKGNPGEIKQSLQRLATRQKREDNPSAVKHLEGLSKTKLSDQQKRRLPDFLLPEMITCVYESEENVLWLGTNEGLWRISENEAEPLDRNMHFRATACLLDNIVMVIDGDGDNGVNVLTKTGVSHIAMKYMSAEEKANFFSWVDYNYVQRRGMLSAAFWNEKKQSWQPKESDNDGLWTSLVAMGDICRYAVLRDDPNASKEDVEYAKKVATRWTEAILLLAYIPGWKGKVASFVRYNEPGTNRASEEYLLEGREFKIKMPDNGPTGYISCETEPENPEDWATQGMPEIVFRNVEGYIARSYHVNDPENDPIPYSEGVFMRKMYDDKGNLISIRVPSDTFKGDDIPGGLTIDSSMEIPERLKKLYKDEVNPKTGKNWGDDDITYKCDTSNDEFVGHYAVWHLAYDILGKDDPELAEMIKTIVARHANHIAENDYCHIDAGGQPTSWARMSREYYLNRYSNGFSDGPLGTLILLQLFKVAHHITGDERWDKEYRKLALDEPYRYADLAKEHFGRYQIMAKEELDDDATEEEIFNRVVKIMNYSDVRMAFVEYYTLTQLETDPILLEKYRQGAESWWQLEKYARDVEWSLLYQLINNEEEQFDGFGRSCIDMLKWQLNRFPLDIREKEIDNSTRPDLREDEGFVWYKDKNIPYSLPLDEKNGTGANFFATKIGRKNRVIPGAYNMIMNYWLARYHNVIDEKGEKGNLPFDDIMKVLNQE
ncbi:MAG TPA: hypothetical protein VFD52_02535 [Clostridia bacterium]|nr:hypothetical protein [Clostridia bacterium]